MQRATNQLAAGGAAASAAHRCDDERQVKVQGLPDINKLPADRESVSTLTCAKFRRNRTSQTRCRCAADAYQAVLATEGAGEHQHKSPWQHKVTLIRNGQDFTVKTRRRTT